MLKLLKSYIFYTFSSNFSYFANLPARRKAYKIFNLIRFMLYFWCSIIHSPWIRACAYVVMGCQMRTSYLFRVSASLLWSLFDLPRWFDGLNLLQSSFLWLKEGQICPTFKKLVFSMRGCFGLPSYLRCSYPGFISGCISCSYQYRI